MDNLKNIGLRHLGIISNDPTRVAMEDATQDVKNNKDADPRGLNRDIKRGIEGYKNYTSSYQESYKTISSTKGQIELLIEHIGNLEQISLNFQDIAGYNLAKTEEIMNSDVVDEVKEATMQFQENVMNALNKLIAIQEELNNKLKAKL